MASGTRRFPSQGKDPPEGEREAGCCDAPSRHHASPRGLPDRGVAFSSKPPRLLACLDGAESVFFHHHSGGRMTQEQDIQNRSVPVEASRSENETWGASRPLGKRGRKRRRRSQIKKAFRRMSPLAVWAAPSALIAAILVVLAFPTALRNGKGGGLRSLAKTGNSPDSTGEFPTTAAGWNEWLRSGAAGIREYREAFDQDIQRGGALLDEVGNLDELTTKLLALGKTNQADVTRVFRAYGARFDSRRALGLAGSLDVRSDPEASRWVAQALLLSGDVLAFDQAWQSSPEAFATNSGMRPWRLAADALLQDEEASRRAQSDLAGMRTAADPSPSAWHASMLVAFLRGDVSGHHELLVSRLTSGDQRLRHWMDHVEILLANEFDTEVDDVLDGLVLDRTHPDEVMEAAKRLVRLGQPGRAKRLIDRRLKADGDSVRLIAAGAFCALAAEQWNECTRLAVSLRMRASASGELDAIAHFLQGCAAMGSGDEGLALNAFDRMAFGNESQAALQLRMVTEGVGLAADRLERSSLRKAWLVARELEGSLGLDGAYWRARSELAGHASQVPDMILAARTAPRLEPRSTASLSCLLRALLLSPDIKPEALELSAALMRELPVPAEWRILRAMALSNSNQAAEAKSLLLPMRPSVVHPRLAGLLRIAWLGVHVSSQDWDAARKAVKEMSSSRLDTRLRAKWDSLAAKIPKA